jgi:hypothetical protein
MGDVDGDGDKDVVTANYHGDSVTVIKNNGDGTLASGKDFSTGSGPSSVFLADIGEDGNGDLDIICADELDSKVSVLENDGSGVYGNIKSYTVGEKPKGVFLSDLDGDGYCDIASANWADDTVSVLINKGDGTFENQVIYNTNTAPRAIYIDVLNSDNHPDIVCVNQHSDSVSVFFNIGDGTFGERTEYPVGANPLSVFLGDLNDDNKIDVLTANLHSDSVTVLLNDGDGVFTKREDYRTDWGPYSVLMANVNIDDKPDIITANSYADTISVRYSNLPPEVKIVEPDGVADYANSTYTITWEDYDADEDAHISLFWDDDPEGYDGVSIVQGLSEDDDGIGGSYIWNISGMPQGDYWIYAKIDDGKFEPAFDYSLGFLTIDHSVSVNNPPSLQITNPDGEGDVANDKFTITWMDSDYDDDAEISLFFDDDLQGMDGRIIASGLSEDADGGSGLYVWNTLLLAEGMYYIYGIIDDGNNEPVSTYSHNPVRINHTSAQSDPPMIRLTEPDGNDDFAHNQYMIIWIDSDSKSEAQISLYYDSDASGFDGTLITSGISQDEFGGSGAYIWNTSAISESEYFIYGIIDNGNEIARDYSPGALTVSHSGIYNTAPSILEISPSAEFEKAHKTFVISWLDLDPDDNARISLFYDDDQTGLDGTIIMEGIFEDDESNFYTWDTEDLPEGDYYIYGLIDDGVNTPVFDYSNGVLRIDHDPEESEGDEISSGRENGSNYLWLIILVLVVLILLFLVKKRRKRTSKESIELSDEDTDSDSDET